MGQLQMEIVLHCSAVYDRRGRIQPSRNQPIIYKLKILACRTLLDSKSLHVIESLES